MESPTENPRSVVLIADDLTGACDAAVYLVAAGLATYVGLHVDDAPPAGWEGYSINTDTRTSSPAEAAERALRACAQARRMKPERIFKKVDSIMRGNIAAEIVAARQALQPRITLFAPAFPSLGRTVRQGRVLIEGEAEPIQIEERLPGLRCSIVPAEALDEFAFHATRAIEDGIDILIPDTLSEDDLERLARAAASVDGLLWVGSGGLTKAIASTIRAKGTIRIARTEKPLLLCVGSNHSATQAQLAQLRREDTVFEPAGSAGYQAANAALDLGRNVVLTLERPQLDAETLREFADSVDLSRAGGLILTGGDTAMHILEALGARGLRSGAEILPGLPQGEILGGLADGLFVVTKSGAFGRPDALARCVDTLRVTPAQRTTEFKEAIQ